MSDRSLAISILERARDLLGRRLAERIVESHREIEADAEGGSCLSEIETIYEQLGGRLAHVNAMLSNLPPTSPISQADATGSEIIYADLASSNAIHVELEAATPLTLLALPAPASFEKRAHAETSIDAFEEIAACIEVGDLTGASRRVSELFDVKPGDAQRWTLALASRMRASPDLARRIAGVSRLLDAVLDEQVVELLCDGFDLAPAESLAIVQALAARRDGPNERE